MKIDQKQFAMAIVRSNIKTLEELAEISGVSRQTISSVRSGKSARPETIAKLAIALNTDINQITEVLKE